MTEVGRSPTTLRDIAAVAGVTESMLRNWRHLGMLPPASVDKAAGGGRPAMYGPREVATAVVLGACTRQGVSRSKLTGVARQLRVELEDARVDDHGFDGLVVTDVAAGRVTLLPDGAGDPRLTAAVADGAVVVRLVVTSP